MASTTQRTTIDVSEAAREVERAAVMFVHGEREGTFPPQAISSLRMAVELTMVLLPQAGRHDAERAVVDEFLIRIGSKLEDADDAGDVIRRAKAQLAEEFPLEN